MDVIEKDTLQGWPQVTAHYFAGDKLTAEQLPACVFSPCTWTPPKLPCILILHTPTTKTLSVLFTHSRNVTKLCRPLCSYALQQIIISTCWWEQGQGHSWSMSDDNPPKKTQTSHKHHKLFHNNVKEFGHILRLDRVKREANLMHWSNKKINKAARSSFKLHF